MGALAPDAVTRPCDPAGGFVFGFIHKLYSRTCGREWTVESNAVFGYLAYWV